MALKYIILCYKMHTTNSYSYAKWQMSRSSFCDRSLYNGKLIKIFCPTRDETVVSHGKSDTLSKDGCYILACGLGGHTFVKMHSNPYGGVSDMSSRSTLSNVCIQDFTQSSLNHYSDVIMGAMASQITSLAFFTQPFIQAQIKENIKASRHWLMSGEFTGEFPARMASNAENVSIWWRHHGLVALCCCGHILIGSMWHIARVFQGCSKWNKWINNVVFIKR